MVSGHHIDLQLSFLSFLFIVIHGKNLVPISRNTFEICKFIVVRMLLTSIEYLTRHLYMKVQ